MKRRARWFIPILVIVVLAASGAIIYITLIHNNHSTAHSTAQGDAYVHVPPLPTPNAQRTGYTNTQFGYTLQYPAQWRIVPSTDGAEARVFFKYDPGFAQAVAVEIHCSANPKRLDAQVWWRQSQPPDGSETPGASLRLASGVDAYVAQGHGQTPYIVYTLTNTQVACQIVTLETDNLNAQIVLTLVNSFQWQ